MFIGHPGDNNARQAGLCLVWHCNVTSFWPDWAYCLVWYNSARGILCLSVMCHVYRTPCEAHSAPTIKPQQYMTLPVVKASTEFSHKKSHCMEQRTQHTIHFAQNQLLWFPVSSFWQDIFSPLVLFLIGSSSLTRYFMKTLTSTMSPACLKTTVWGLSVGMCL